MPSPLDSFLAADLINPKLGMGDHPYKLTFGQDGSFMAMIEYATNKDTPQVPSHPQPLTQKTKP